MRVASLDKYIRFGAHDKKGRAEREDEEPLKIDITSVHNVKRTCFRHDLVQDVYRSEEHTSELQSLRHLVCRLLLEKKQHKRTTDSAARIDLVPSPHAGDSGCP